MRQTHRITCQYCSQRFELFEAVWCPHLDAPSKTCPHCGHRLCGHPAYREPRYWKDAPLAFRRRGFQRLFLFYV